MPRSRRPVVRVHRGALLNRSQCRADLSDRALDVADYERRFDPNDAITGTRERHITAGVGARSFAVILAIDFNHEALRGSQEVRDEAAEQRYLAAKEHAQTAPANAVP